MSHTSPRRPRSGSGQTGWPQPSQEGSPSTLARLLLLLVAPGSDAFGHLVPFAAHRAFCPVVIPRPAVPAYGES